MEQMIKALETSFSSKRLLFKPLEDNEQHNEFLYRHEWASPIMSGLGNVSTLQPLNRKLADKRNSWIAENCLLAVVIVLRPESPQDSSQGSGAHSEDVLVGHLHLTKPSNFGRDTSIGLGIISIHQGKGYGREALNWALDYTFRYAGLHRMEISTVGFNERAIALYKSVGFVEEGRKRKCAFFDMQWHDYVEMSMLEEEYRALRESK